MSQTLRTPGVHVWREMRTNKRKSLGKVRWVIMWLHQCSSQIRETSICGRRLVFKFVLVR